MNVGIELKRKVYICLISLIALAACSENGGVPVENEPQEEPVREEKTEQEQSKNEQPVLPETELQKKDEGEDVVMLQEVLALIGYTIPADGKYSDSLTWAITDFQLQAGDLYVTGIYDKETREALDEMLKSEEMVEEGAGLPQLAEPVVTDSGSEVIGNPYDQLALVNKNQALPEDYTPHDLVVPDVAFPFEEDSPKKQLRAPAAEALEKLFKEAEEAGYQLYAQSSYRSYERQVTLFEAYANEHGEAEANTFSARPGESEHQTGLSMDITSASVDFRLTGDFGETPEGEWVRDNAHRFGFIIRYPEGKEEITQYQYEPWHLRYVGERTAAEIMENQLTLEEYFSEE
jgi:D-alanyl-D-alanine carboxypeptidase